MGDDKQMKENLLKIINNYGISNQLKKLSEETFELQEAIIKLEQYIINVSNEDPIYDEYIKKEIDNKYILHIEEEIADVLVMVMQFKEYYHIDGKEIMKIMREKIDRQLDRIEKEKNK